MVKYCPEHGLKDVGTFCNQCGRVLEQGDKKSFEELLDAPVKFQCPNCRADLKYGKHTYCNKCGQKVSLPIN